MATIQKIPENFDETLYERHPDPKLSELVLVSKNDTYVKALDGINGYIKHRNGWFKTEVHVVNQQSIISYIQNDCHFVNGLCVYGRS